MNFITIDKSRFKDAVHAYWLWKELNAYVKNSHSRGINFPETISETAACYALDFKLNRGSGGDAMNPRNGEIVEFKATSNWNRDTSSFSPIKDYYPLFFIRLDQRQDKAYIYDLNLSEEDLKQLPMNKNETFLDQQKQGRRPRFSIINKIIEPQDLQPVAMIDFRKETTHTL